MKGCACHSGLAYGACCRPLHRGEDAPSPERLMRSRFAAYALGLGDYLVDTLADGHPDRELARADLVRALSRARQESRFLGLTILHCAATGDEGEVLFHARVFSRGSDRSFAELSTFRRELGRWRYASGLLVQGAHLPEDLTTLDRAAFLARASPA